VNADERLAAIVTDLESVGITCLVMGGHAVRFYGVQRTTIDFDLHLAPDCWPDLTERLARTSLAATQPIVEGNSWRPHAFRRFQIGRLPDGREEWLEFWRENHLLAPFSDLFVRRETGPYGGRDLAFLSLPDLIRSKETERTSDWQDVDLLEEFLDARHLGQARAGTLAVADALASLRTRTGLESFQQAGFLGDGMSIAHALEHSTHPITQALLLPFAPTAVLCETVPPIENVVATRLTRLTPGFP